MNFVEKHKTMDKKITPGKKQNIPKVTKVSTERRKSRRFKVKMQVDYSSEENFLFSYIDNISEVGIFIATRNPLLPGTRLKLRFSPPGMKKPIEVDGEVVWINPYEPGKENINPGMGIKFLGLTGEKKKKIQELITTIAYLNENWV